MESRFRHWLYPPLRTLRDAEQTIAVCKMAPKSIVVATHMEALDHGTVSREDLRIHAQKNGISKDQLLIPEDGQTLVF